jgi:hypothetical protein
MPDNESSAKIDTAAITEAIRQWVKDLAAEVERINAAREAMPPPIDRAATSIRLKPHRPPGGLLLLQGPATSGEANRARSRPQLRGQPMATACEPARSE